jgi:hypothetical protein
MEGKGVKLWFESDRNQTIGWMKWTMRGAASVFLPFPIPTPTLGVTRLFLFTHLFLPQFVLQISNKPTQRLIKQKAASSI